MQDPTTLSTAGEKRKNLSRPVRLPDAVRGVVAGVSANGDPLVDFCTNSTGAPIAAASIVAVQSADVGREAILLYEDGDPLRPILVGLVQTSVNPEAKVTERKPVEVTVDGERITLCAEEEIVLRCGQASITLTRSGKVVIRGTHLVSRSSGPNRIRGASVHLN